MKVGIVMDPISGINIKKDSSFAMLLAAQARGCELYYMEQADLYLDMATARARMHPVEVEDNPDHWFRLGDAADRPLTDLDIVLMRKDPPMDADYLVTTWILEQAQHQGVMVVNDPRSLRDANEKMFCTWFSGLMAPTLITPSDERLRAFIAEHADVIVKPLHSMGGDSIFRLTMEDPNLSVILETITRRGHSHVMAQKYIADIVHGDKRILLINGVAVPWALARIPASGETRGNLAAGGQARGQALTDQDRNICERVGPVLKKKGLWFVGLDVIGDYLTEINVTSPTCIRELDRAFDLDIGGQLIDALIAHRQ
jgi:glutathione synthase